MELEEYNQLKAEVKEEIIAELETTLKALMRGQDDINKTLFTMGEDIKPVVRIFKNSDGFVRITVAIVKIIGSIGIIIGGLYAIAEFLERIKK